MYSTYKASGLSQILDDVLKAIAGFDENIKNDASIKVINNVLTKFHKDILPVFSKGNNPNVFELGMITPTVLSIVNDLKNNIAALIDTTNPLPKIALLTALIPIIAKLPPKLIPSEPNEESLLSFFNPKALPVGIITTVLSMLLPQDIKLSYPKQNGKVVFEYLLTGDYIPSLRKKIQIAVEEGNYLLEALVGSEYDASKGQESLTIVPEKSYTNILQYRGSLLLSLAQRFSEQLIAYNDSQPSQKALLQADIKRLTNEIVTTPTLKAGNTKLIKRAKAELTWIDPQLEQCSALQKTLLANMTSIAAMFSAEDKAHTDNLKTIAEAVADNFQQVKNHYNELKQQFNEEENLLAKIPILNRMKDLLSEMDNKIRRSRTVGDVISAFEIQMGEGEFDISIPNYTLVFEEQNANVSAKLHPVGEAFSAYVKEIAHLSAEVKSIFKDAVKMDIENQQGIFSPLIVENTDDLPSLIVLKEGLEKQIEQQEELLIAISAIDATLRESIRTASKRTKDECMHVRGLIEKCEFAARLAAASPQDALLALMEKREQNSNEQTAINNQILSYQKQLLHVQTYSPELITKINAINALIDEPIAVDERSDIWDKYRIANTMLDEYLGKDEEALDGLLQQQLSLIDKVKACLNDALLNLTKPIPFNEIDSIMSKIMPPAIGKSKWNVILEWRKGDVELFQYYEGIVENEKKSTILQKAVVVTANRSKAIIKMLEHCEVARSTKQDLIESLTAKKASLNLLMVTLDIPENTSVDNYLDDLQIKITEKEQDLQQLKEENAQMLAQEKPLSVYKIILDELDSTWDNINITEENILAMLIWLEDKALHLNERIIAAQLQDKSAVLRDVLRVKVMSSVNKVIGILTEKLAAAASLQELTDYNSWSIAIAQKINGALNALVQCHQGIAEIDVSAVNNQLLELKSQYESKYWATSLAHLENTAKFKMIPTIDKASVESNENTLLRIKAFIKEQVSILPECDAKNRAISAMNTIYNRDRDANTLASEDIQEKDKAISESVKALNNYMTNRAKRFSIKDKFFDGDKKIREQRVLLIKEHLQTFKNSSDTEALLKCVEGSLIEFPGGHFHAVLSQIKVAIMDIEDNARAFYDTRPALRAEDEFTKKINAFSDYCSQRSTTVKSSANKISSGLSKDYGRYLANSSPEALKRLKNKVSIRLAGEALVLGEHQSKVKAILLGVVTVGTLPLYRRMTYGKFFPTQREQMSHTIQEDSKQIKLK